MLLSQQAELASIDSNEVVIGLSPNWENMIKSRKIIIENAVKKVFGDQIKLNFSIKKINIANSEKSHNELIINPNENTTKQKNDFQQSNSTNPNNQKESFDKSTKNLANFFNGEIIDLDE